MASNFRSRFAAMVDELQANSRVQIRSVTFGDPAPAEEIAALGAAVPVLPPGLTSFFQEMNGFGLEWEITVEDLRSNSDADCGFINIGGISDVFDLGVGRTWHPGQPGGDRFKPIRPVDIFVPEACAALMQTSGGNVPDTIHFHIFGEDTIDTRYTFLEWLDRLIASRGLWYWIESLCPELQEEQPVVEFRKKMPLLFADYDNDLFQPKT